MAAGCSFVGYSGLPYLYHRRRRATARSPACAVTAPIRAHDSLQGRHPPVIGRPQAVRPPSRPHSGPLRALQTCGGNPGVPLNHPSTPLPGTAGSRIDRGGARPRPSLVGSQATTRTTIDGRPPRPSSCCSAWTSATASLTAAGSLRGRAGSRGSRERRPGADPGAWPSPGPSFDGNRAPQAVRRPSRPHSGPLRAFQALGGTPGYPLKYPSTPLPGASGSGAAATSPPQIDQSRALRPPATAQRTTPDQALSGRAARCWGSNGVRSRSIAQATDSNRSETVRRARA